MRVIRGRVVKLGDRINTDIIAPGRWKSEGMEVLRAHTMEAVQADFCRLVRMGDILVAGRDFGCGSHREQAVTVLQALGIQAVVADSVARLYLRNGIALGLPVFSADGISAMTEQSDQLSITFLEDVIELKNDTSGQCMQICGLPEDMKKILEAGGVFACLKQALEDHGG